MSTQPFVIERKLNASASRIWQALTDSDQMKQWYFDIPGFKAEPGFEFSFTGGTEEKQYLHLCKVIEVIPGKKLIFSWRYDGYPGNSFVTFELLEERDATTLKLTHAGIETLGPGNPDFAKENFAEGWTSIVGTQLKNFLEK